MPESDRPSCKNASGGQAASTPSGSRERIRVSAECKRQPSAVPQGIWIGMPRCTTRGPYRMTGRESGDFTTPYSNMRKQGD
jgi:hypothetical protein